MKQEAVKTDPGELSKKTSKGAVLILLLPERVEGGTSIFTNVNSISDTEIGTEHREVRIVFSLENIKEIYDLRETFNQHGGDFTISFLKKNNLDTTILSESAKELQANTKNGFFVLEFKDQKKVKILRSYGKRWIKVKKLSEWFNPVFY